ncbi:MAG: hypothetical protein JJE39_13355 [Vicinamibacteria bacterium]|nr:hypothetical protein [Vicinamibacteria bacterium]
MKALGREFALFAFFVLASGFVLRPLPFHLGDTIPAGSDPPHHLYILSWLLDHGLSADRFEGRMFSPAKNAVLRSDLSIGTVALMTPIAPFIHDDEPLVRFNLATWLALAFSGWAFCLLARSWTESMPAGLFAGITAVLGSHQSLHYVHLNLLSVGWLPIFLLALDRLLTRGSPGWSVLTGLSFALVACSSGYYGVAASVIAVVFFARRPSAQGLKWGGIAALLALILLSPYLIAYASLHAEESLVRTSRELAKGSWTITDVGSRTLLHRLWNPAPGEPLFPGLAVLGLAIYSLRRGGRLEKTLGLAVGLLFWLGLGEPGGLYRILGLVPPFSSMRHPVTLSAVGLMLLSVMAAFGLARLPKSRAFLSLTLLGTGIVETLPPPNDFFDVAPGVPPVYEVVLKLPPGPILDIPPYEASPLIWAARRGFETVNGGGAFIPALTNRIETTIQNHWLTDGYQPIDESKAAAILLNETSMRYLILPGGRRGGLAPLMDRFAESHCFKKLGVYQSDQLFEAVRDASCPAWAGGAGAEPSP